MHTAISATVGVAHRVCSGTALVGQPVSLDGRASRDPDQGPQPLRFARSVATAPLGSVLRNAELETADQALAHVVPDVPGLYAFTLQVSDGQARTDETVLVTVAQDVPPNARAGADQTVTLGDTVHLDGRASDDPDQVPQPLTFAWHLVSRPTDSTLTTADVHPAQTATARFAPDVTGSYVLAVTVWDGLASAADHVLITVRPPTSPPRCPTAVAQPAQLWPPHHALVPVTLGLSTPEAVTMTVTAVWQDEPVHGHDAGDSSPDAVLQGHQVLLRAERAEGGNGRVYRVAFTADAGHLDGPCTGTVTVCVPPNARAACGDEGPKYDATQQDDYAPDPGPDPGYAPDPGDAPDSEQHEGDETESETDRARHPVDTPDSDGLTQEN